MRLKTSEIAGVKDRLLKDQKYKCPLCEGSMRAGHKKPALDHDHKTGYIRDVLCINCNGMEGSCGCVVMRVKCGNHLRGITDGRETYSSLVLLWGGISGCG